MNHKQRLLDEFPALFRHSVGFGPIFQHLDHMCSNQTANQGYPPYNIAQVTANGESWFEITMALAGFTDDDLEITVKNSELLVSGNTDVLNSSEEVHVDYLHRGIAERSFKRSFALGQYVEVESAKLRNGILTIRLAEVVPEEAKTKHITINS